MATKPRTPSKPASRRPSKQATKPRPATPRKSSPSRPKANVASASAAPARPDSKQSQLITALKTKAGCTLADMTTLTGWQPHSVRGVISGVLRKKLGLNVVLTKTDGGARYRVAPAATR